MIGHITLLLASVLICPGAAQSATTGKTFTTPEEAVAALRVATSGGDTNALREIFGPASDDLLNPDRVQAANDLAKFNAALVATNHLVRISATNIELEVGADLWPFPVPLVKNSSGWYFDTDAGEDELLSRRIGKNELSTLETVRAFVDAQREYASRDRDGDGVLEYAQKLSSSPGKKDGLFWPEDLDGELSPLGPMVADAQAEGYGLGKKNRSSEPSAFHGYYFKILERQGKHAPGGKYNYVINGNMIGGFALVAWPASYGDSGIMTFIVNQQGRVYQKDLGEATSKIVRKMDTYDPDPSWKISPQ
ncbi:MAG TPA: DUF2950 domain-containing protein [Candidatus Dormibacteraeota bacterium]|nr:DUF2950 domain-containing protein [Candidatus Dormibacteraeota bacterium]